MNQYAKKKAFEKAGEVKRKILPWERHINDIALIKEDLNNSGNQSDFRIEAYDIAHMSKKYGRSYDCAFKWGSS